MEFVELFKKCLGKTLLWPSNFQAIEGAKWIVPTDSEESAHELETFLREKLHAKDVDFVVIPELLSLEYNHGRLLFEALMMAMAECVDKTLPMLMCTPDYIFGDGTIENIKQVAGGDGCVSFAHMRVLPSVLKEITDDSLSNFAVQTFGFHHPHGTWVLSEKKLDENGVTFRGGISWEWMRAQDKIDEVCAVEHFLPAPFFVNFKHDDIEFFNKRHGSPHDSTFAVWDHVWPTKLLQDARLRYIGSSDIACMIEVTGAEKNMPPPNGKGVTNRYGYGLKLFHNQMHRQFISTFRGLKID